MTQKILQSTNMKDYTFVDENSIGDNRIQWAVSCAKCETVLFTTNKMQNGQIITSSNITYRHPKLKDITDGDAILCPECNDIYLISNPMQNYQNPIEKLIEVLAE